MIRCSEAGLLALMFWKQGIRNVEHGKMGVWPSCLSCFWLFFFLRGEGLSVSFLFSYINFILILIFFFLGLKS